MGWRDAPVVSRPTPATVAEDASARAAADAQASTAVPQGGKWRAATPVSAGQLVRNAPRPKVSTSRAIAEGVSQGSSAGLAEEAAAAMYATPGLGPALRWADENLLGMDRSGMPDDYAGIRDMFRGAIRQAREDRPAPFLLGNAAGGALLAKGLGPLAGPMPATGGGIPASGLNWAGAGKALPFGGLVGFGTSESPDVGGQLWDMGVGGAMSVPFGALTPKGIVRPEGIGPEFSWLDPTTWANPRSARAKGAEAQARSLRPTAEQAREADATFPGGMEGVGGYLASARHPFDQTPGSLTAKVLAAVTGSDRMKTLASPRPAPILGPFDRAPAIADKLGGPAQLAGEAKGVLEQAVSRGEPVGGGAWSVGQWLDDVTQGPLADLRANQTAGPGAGKRLASTVERWREAYDPKFKSVPGSEYPGAIEQPIEFVLDPSKPKPWTPGEQPSFRRETIARENVRPIETQPFTYELDPSKPQMLPQGRSTPLGTVYDRDVPSFGLKSVPDGPPQYAVAPQSRVEFPAIYNPGRPATPTDPQGRSFGARSAPIGDPRYVREGQVAGVEHPANAPRQDVSFVRTGKAPIAAGEHLKTEITDQLPKPGQPDRMSTFEGGLDAARALLRKQLEVDYEQALGPEGGAAYRQAKTRYGALEKGREMSEGARRRGIGSQSTPLGTRVTAGGGGPATTFFARPLEALRSRTDPAEAYALTRLAEALEGNPASLLWAATAAPPQLAGPALDAVAGGLKVAAPAEKVAPRRRSRRERSNGQ